MSYAKALALLEAYGPQTLVRHVYQSRSGLCCAIGAIIPWSRTLPIDDASGSCDAIGDLDGDGPAAPRWRMHAELVAIGMTDEEAKRLQAVNDLSDDEAPCDESAAERYARVLAWLRAQVAAERAS